MELKHSQRLLNHFHFALRKHFLIRDLLFLPISTIESALRKRLITQCCVSRLACSRLSGHIEPHLPGLQAWNQHNYDGHEFSNTTVYRNTLATLVYPTVDSGVMFLSIQNKVRHQYLPFINPGVWNGDYITRNEPLEA